jgi:hypothetical protein
MACRVRVQVVLYGADPGWARRLTESVARAVRVARDHGAVSDGSIAFGDCAPEPVLSEDDLLALDETCADEQVAPPDYHFFDANRYHSGGQNALADLALEHGSADDWLLVLNPECYVAPDLLVELMRVAADNGVVAVEARQVPLEHPKAYDRATLDVSWASGACLLVQHAAFGAVGGFDETYFPMYCNDVDLSWRLRLDGHRLRYAPSAAVFHDKRIDPETGHPIPTALEEESGLLARLMLTTRYARPDLCAETIGLVRAHGSVGQRRAVDTFERFRADGQLPEAIVDAGRVADFVAGEYGERRY